MATLNIYDLIYDIAFAQTDHVANSEAIANQVQGLIDSKSLYKVVATAELSESIISEFGEAALVFISNIPEPNLVMFKPATIASLLIIEKELARQKKLIILKNALDDAYGEEIEFSEIPDLFLELINS